MQLHSAVRCACEHLRSIGIDAHMRRVQELVESLSGRQQLGIAAVLFALALGLIVMARPQGLVGDSVQPTSVRVDSVYP